jgi:chromosomal replication initiation ATPase DnaA
MNNVDPITILEKKQTKYDVKFDSNQQKAIIEAMFEFRVGDLDISINENDLCIMIIEIVGQYFKLDPMYYRVANKKGFLVEARQIAIYFVSIYTKNSLESIAKLFNRKAHATILHSIKVVKSHYATERVYKLTVENIKNLIDEKIQKSL